MKRWSLLILGGLLVAVVTFGMLQEHRVSAADAQKKTVDFTLSDINGRPVRLSDYRGKVVLVDFWATWCPHCVGEIPHLMAVQNAAERQGAPLQILGVAMDNNTNDPRNFAVQRGMNYPVLYKDAQQMQPFGEIYGLPTKVIVDKDGVIVDRIIGEATKDELVQHICRYGCNIHQ